MCYFRAAWGIDGRRCFQCGQENPAPGFCSGCGSPLALNEYIARAVKEQLSSLITARDVLEAKSAQTVFEKVTGWFKLWGLGIGVCVAILGYSGISKLSDWSSNIDKAKEDVIKTAADVKKNADQTKVDMAQEAASLKNDIDASKAQLHTASELAPEIDSLRNQLTEATIELQAQQKVISNSEAFIKSVFSSHIVEVFQIGQPPVDRYAIRKPPSGVKQTIVFLLLDSTPIKGTLQLQYHIYAQPPGSYFFLHNLVIFVWADSADALKSQQLSVSYFPDKDDTETIKSLSEHDGRVYADGEPLPFLNEVDPDFPGDRWFDRQFKLK